MGFLDGVSNAFGRVGKDQGLAVNSTADEVGDIEKQLTSLSEQRRDLMGDLGESLYEVVLSNRELLEGRESIVQRIQELDRQKKALEDEREELEKQKLNAIATSEVCPQCGYPLVRDALFCVNCGVRLRRCDSCGSVVSSNQRFCATCGHRLQENPDELPVSDELPMSDEFGSSVEHGM